MASFYYRESLPRFCYGSSLLLKLSAGDILLLYILTETQCSGVETYYHPTFALSAGRSVEEMGEITPGKTHLPCVSALPSRLRHCLCPVCLHCRRGEDTAFPCVFSRPSWRRHCLCCVLPLPSWPRHCLYLVRSTASAATTLPLRVFPLPFAAKTLPLPCTHTAFPCGRTQVQRHAIAFFPMCKGSPSQGRHCHFVQEGWHLSVARETVMERKVHFRSSG